MWLWMALAGLGIGPSFAVFTLIVQNAVSVDRIGTATSSLTFFQQIGGTVGLTLAGTILADRITTELPAQLIKAGVPPQFLTGFSPSSPAAAQLDLFGTGDLAGRLAKVIPPEGQGLIPAIVNGIHEAFSIAVASTFWIWIGGAIIAAVLVLLLHEVPMRQTFEVADYAPERTPGPEREANAG
jgi:hypothetical protein